MKLILIFEFTNARTSRFSFKNLIQLWITIKFWIFIDFFCFVCETFAKLDCFLIRRWFRRRRQMFRKSIILIWKHNCFCNDSFYHNHNIAFWIYFLSFDVFVCFSHAYCVHCHWKCFDWIDFVVVVEIVVEFYFYFCFFFIVEIWIVEWIVVCASFAFQNFFQHNDFRKQILFSRWHFFDIQQFFFQRRQQFTKKKFDFMHFFKWR